MFFKLGVLKNFPIFTGNTFFLRTPPVAAPVIKYKQTKNDGI